MQVHEALLSRRTIHDYKQEPVAREILLQALEAAMFAPNHKLTYPWRFTVVGGQTRKKLADLNVELKEQEDSSLSALKKQALRDKVLQSADLVVFSQRKSDDMFQAKEDYATLACAIHNLSLSLWAEGVGSKWSTGALIRAAKTYDILSIDSQQEEIVGFVWVGIPQRIPKPSKRPHMSEVMRELP